MISIPTVAAALLALALGQSEASRDRPSPGPGVPSIDDAPPTPVTPLSSGVDEPVPVGIPFLPTFGRAQVSSDGFFLELGLLSEVRARTINSEGTETIWGTDLEITPGLALEIQGPRLAMSIGYAPRFSIPFNVVDFSLAVLNRATFRADWKLDPLWTLSGIALAVVGDYSQLAPASTPGGAGPAPPVLNPVRSFETYPYVGIDAALRIAGDLSPRTRVRLSGGYFDVGGLGTAGQAAQPRAWGPQGEGSFTWDASNQATLTTTVAGQNWIMCADGPPCYVAIASLTETWRHRWSSDLETSVSAGPGYSTRDVESRTAAGHLIPVASLHIEYHPESRQPLRLALDAALAPYVDTYTTIPYQRVTFGGTLEWRASDTWQLRASLSAALVPYSQLAPESYGNLGASASYSPISILVLSIGGFSQAQIQSATGAFGGFLQWTGYVSVAFRDRLSL